VSSRATADPDRLKRLEGSPAGIDGSAPLSPNVSRQELLERRLKFRPDIEGLRAVAIALVVLYHAGWRGARSGFLGVDVFFVLSGFLITGLLLDELAATGRISLTKFWARRARRLLPAAAVVTLVVLVASAAWLSPYDQHTFGDTARAFSVFGSNLLFAARSLEYFGGEAARDPLLHTWSLSVEEQFYLFFAPAMLVVGIWVRGRGADVLRRRLITLAALASIVSFVGCLVLARRYPVVAFYALPARAWEFALGALAILVIRRANRLPGMVLEVVSLAGLAAIVTSAVMPAPRTPSPGFLTLVPTLGTAALLFAGASTRQTLVGRTLAVGPMRLVGRLSYAWYLWHWPALVFLHERNSNPSLLLSVSVALLSLIPAAVAYWLIESPIRFSVRLEPFARQTVAAAVALALVLVAMSSLAIRRADDTLATPRYVALAEAQARSRIWTDGCLLGLQVTQSPACVYGDSRADTTVVLFGDSHAAQWFPAVDSIARRRGWRLVALTKTACPVPQVIVINAQLARRYTECEAWRQSALDRIAALRPALIVAASARSYKLLVGGNRHEWTESSTAAREDWRAGLQRTVTSLAGSGARVIVLEDTPRMPFDVQRCLVKNSEHQSRCAVPVGRAVDTAFAALEQSAVRQTPAASYLSFNATICDSVCSSVGDGVVRYQDSNHLSVRYVSSLAGPLSESLSRALLPPPAIASGTQKPATH
jgi:peptidoglycan/LPS O-acetylase OafA/YrhL